MQISHSRFLENKHFLFDINALYCYNSTEFLLNNHRNTLFI